MRDSLAQTKRSEQFSAYPYVLKHTLLFKHSPISIEQNRNTNQKCKEGDKERNAGRVAHPQLEIKSFNLYIILWS